MFITSVNDADRLAGFEADDDEDEEEDERSKEAAARADPLGIFDDEAALDGRDAIDSGPADRAAAAAAVRTSCCCSNWFSGEVGSGGAIAAADMRWPDGGREVLI